MTFSPRLALAGACILALSGALGACALAGIAWQAAVSLT